MMEVGQYYKSSYDIRVGLAFFILVINAANRIVC